MRKKRLEPNSPEAVEAILQRIRSMTKEEWQYWIDKLSRAPEGVYDPWSDENWALSNGAAPPRDRTDGNH
jgi:hypothetical protein